MSRQSKRKLEIEDVEQYLWYLVYKRKINSVEFRAVLGYYDEITNRKFVYDKSHIPKNKATNDMLFTYGDNEFRQIVRMSKTTFGNIRDVIHESQTVELNMKNNELQQRLIEHNDNKARYEREFLREEKRHEEELNYKKRLLVLDEKKSNNQLELEKEKLKKETFLDLIKLNKSEEEINRLMNMLFPKNI